MASRLEFFPLFKGVRLASLAASNDFSVAGERLYMDLDRRDLVHHILGAEEITLISLGEAHVANLQWNLFLYSGFNRGTEKAAVPIGTTVTAIGSVRHTPYSTISSFLPESRFAIGWGYAPGAAGIYTGLASGGILVKRTGM